MKFSGLILIVLCKLINGQSPYANEYPYKKYGFDLGLSVGGSHLDSNLDSDSTGFFKNRMRSAGGKINNLQDAGKFYNLENTQNGHELAQTKRGSTTDNLTHVQGEDFETDKSHKRKHIKSGFQNSYHKEENGSKSSFYEDSDDTGGKVIYDKRHGTKGDQHDNVYKEGQRTGVVRDKFDDRRAGYDSRDMQDRQQDFAEDQGKHHGYHDGYRRGMDESFEVRRLPPPPPPYINRNFEENRMNDRDRLYDRYDPDSHWGYDPRLPPPPQRQNPNNNFFSRRRITIYDDPRDELEPRDRDRLRDGGNFMSRSQITRRSNYDYATPLRLRYRGH